MDRPILESMAERKKSGRGKRGDRNIVVHTHTHTLTHAHEGDAERISLIYEGFRRP